MAVIVVLWRAQSTAARILGAASFVGSCWDSRFLQSSKQGRDRGTLLHSFPMVIRRIVHLAKRFRTLLFWLLGVGGVLDLLKEFARSKLMDLAYERLGNFGQWLLDFPVAIITVTLTAILLSLAVVAIIESKTKAESTILDHNSRPYEIPNLSANWTTGFCLAIFFIAALLSYGVYKYYWIISGPELTFLGYHVELSNPEANPFVNIYFENIGGAGKLRAHAFSGIAPSSNDPKEVKKELIRIFKIFHLILMI